MAVQVSNGTTVPHATSYADFLDKLVTFAVAQGWVNQEDQRSAAGAYIILKGVGTTGSDAIYVGLQKYADALNDNYGLRLKGYTGYVNGDGFTNQPGANPQDICTPLWNDTLPYWLCVSSRVIKYVVKVGSVYHSGYLGYPLPFASPNQYPYPLVVAGSSVYEQKYNTQSNYVSNFTHPFDTGDASNHCAIAVRLPDGTWYQPYFGRVGPTQAPNNYLRGIAPYAEMFAGSAYTPGQHLQLERPALDGTYTLEPTYILRADLSGQSVVSDILAELDGIKFVSAFGNAAENTVTVSSRTFLVIPNVYRTSDGHLWAMELA